MSDPFFLTLITLLCAILLDLLLGEPRRWHPLVGFGMIAGLCERCCNRTQLSRTPLSKVLRLFLGTINWFVLVIGTTLFFMVLISVVKNIPAFVLVVDVLIVYLAIGYKSLRQHAQAVVKPLKHHQLENAQNAVGMIVSRDTESMQPIDIRKATIESVLENGNDAIYAPIFWFIIGGVPAVLIYRLSNTLDAMWGYKTERFLWFGRFAARMDDILNWVPARLTALSYTVLGNTRQAIQCWLHQSDQLESPNGGVVMTTGAGALGLRLGGYAIYHGVRKQKPHFGCEDDPVEGDIERSVQLIDKTLWLWCVVLTLYGVVAYFSRASML